MLGRVSVEEQSRKQGHECHGEEESHSIKYGSHSKMDFEFFSSQSCFPNPKWLCFTNIYNHAVSAISWWFSSLNINMYITIYFP